MRTAFIETLVELAKEDNRIYLLTGDLGYSVLEKFQEKLPKQFINVGVAEQNMTGIAAGLAMSGKIVFTYSIANFPVMRCLEQIRVDICYNNLNVKVVSVGGGLSYGTLGYTHHGVEDIAVMRVLPNMTVISPGDKEETKWALKSILEKPGPCFLRLGKTSEISIHKNLSNFKLGKAIQVIDGNDVTLISTGDVLNVAHEAAKILISSGLSVRFLSMPSIKPLDIESLYCAFQQTKAIFTVEEHSLIGGLGSAVSEILSESQYAGIIFKRIALADGILNQAGGQDFLRNLGNLTPDKIAKTIKDTLQSKKNASVLNFVSHS